MKTLLLSVIFCLLSFHTRRPPLANVSIYTRKGDTIYVILLEWPGTEKPMLLTALNGANLDGRSVRDAVLLSVKRNFQCRIEPGSEGLVMTIPDKSRIPSDAAHIIKLTLE